MKKKRAGRRDRKFNDQFHSNVQRECVISFFVLLYVSEILNNFNRIFFLKRERLRYRFYAVSYNSNSPFQSLSQQIIFDGTATKISLVASSSLIKDPCIGAPG